MGAPAPEGDIMPPPEAPTDDAGLPPASDEAAGGAAVEGLEQNDTLANLKENIQEAAQEVQKLEMEVSTESQEEIDLSGMGEPGGLGAEGEVVEEPIEMQDIFSDLNLAEKASNLANEHHESADEDYFGPSASSELEASLDKPEFASLETMFAHEASADPLAGLFERTAASIDGFDVVNSYAEAATHFQSEHGKEDRDNKTDHDEDILSLLTEGLNEQSNDQERVKQDATPELETPAAKEASTSKKPVLKHIKAASGAVPIASVNVADVLFATIDAYDEERNAQGRRY